MELPPIVTTVKYLSKSERRIRATKTKRVPGDSDLRIETFNDVVFDVIGLVGSKNYAIALDSCLQRIVNLQQQLEQQQRQENPKHH